MFDAFKKIFGTDKSNQNGDVPENPMQEKAHELLESALQCLERGDTKDALKYLNMSLSYAPSPRAYLELVKFNDIEKLDGQSLNEASKNVEKGLALCSASTEAGVEKELKELQEKIKPLIQLREEERQEHLRQLEARQPKGKGRDAAALKKEFQSFRKSAWIPVTENGDGEADCSKFGGTPLVSEEYPWPECSLCGSLMKHFLQLNLANLPDEINSDDYGFTKIPKGWLQFFFCTEHWEENGNSFVARLIDEAPISVSEPKAKSKFTRQIKGWKSIDDFPSFDDFDDLVETGQTDKVEDEWLEEIYDNRLGCDKLLGWPVWDQSPESENCPQCKNRMVYFFQIASEENVPHLFGDNGTGHIHMCPKDFNLAFSFSS